VKHIFLVPKTYIFALKPSTNTKNKFRVGTKIRASQVSGNKQLFLCLWSLELFKIVFWYFFIHSWIQLKVKDFVYILYLWCFTFSLCNKSSKKQSESCIKIYLYMLCGNEKIKTSLSVQHTVNAHAVIYI